MIITITGKPCSGKGTISKIFCEKYKFDYICVGDIMREFAKKEGYNDFINFNNNTDLIKKYDKLVDEKTREIGIERANENIVFDSRLAWHFIPNSFKVFIDVDWTIAGERLISANRETEKVSNIDEAIAHLQHRWETENLRYTMLYNLNNLNLDNYDFVISSDNLSPEELADKIFNEYTKFLKK